MCLGDACPECSKAIAMGGIFFIECRDGEQGNSNPYRTGRLIAVREEAVKQMFNKYERINFMEYTPFEKLFGHLLTPPQPSDGF